MDFTLNAKTLSETLSVASGLTGSDHVSLDIRKNTLRVHAAKDGTYVTLVIPDVQVDDAGGKMSIMPEGLNKITRGRGDLRFVLDNSMLNITSVGSKAYASTINCLPYEEVEHLKPAESGLELDAKTLFNIRQCLPFCRLSTVYVKEPMFLQVKQEKGRIHVVVYDNFHTAYHEVTDNDLTEDLEFSIPLERFDTICNLADDQDFSLTIEENRIYAKGKTFFVSLPNMENPMGEQSVDAILGLIDAYKNPDSVTTIPFGELKSAIENSLAIANDGAPLEFSFAKDKLKIHLKTSYGTLSSYLKAEEGTLWKKGVTHKVEPYLLSDLVGCMYGSDVISVSFVDRRLMFMEGQNGPNLRSFFGCNVV
jgi:DNA polymerase III sliding clamp (beta) subunit (PCNA family)